MYSFSSGNRSLISLSSPSSSRTVGCNTNLDKPFGNDTAFMCQNVRRKKN